MARPRNFIQQIELPASFKRELFALLGNGKVEVIGFGTFEVVRIPARTMYHNFSQAEKRIKTYCKLKFTQTPLIKDVLTKKTPHAKD